MFDIKQWLGLSDYTSEADQFLVKIRKAKSALSSSQQTEQDKYNRINLLRDSEIKPSETTNVWDKF